MENIYLEKEKDLFEKEIELKPVINEIKDRIEEELEDWIYKNTSFILITPIADSSLAQITAKL